MMPDAAFHAHSRGRAVAWARALLRRDDWLLLDTETTELSGYMVEIAIVRPDGSTAFESLLNPQRGIEGSAQLIHGIAPEMVQDAPTFVQLEPQLRALLHGKTVVVYNAEYDANVLRREVDRLHLRALRAAMPEPHASADKQREWLARYNGCFEAGRAWIDAVNWVCAMEHYAAFVGEWNQGCDSSPPAVERRAPGRRGLPGLPGADSTHGGGGGQ